MRQLLPGLVTVLLTIQTVWAQADPPNVILIVTDDQGYGDLQSHGNPILKTPAMDQLRREAIRFTDFHVAPMCSPTRGQLMTGRDAMKNGCTAVCQGRSMMRAELPTMADMFAQSGYATGHFGKWHLGDSYPHRPQDRGFQETIHHRAWGITSLADHWENSYFDPVLSHNGTDRKFEGYCTDIFFREATKWIETCRTDGQPFFLYLPTNTPHVPNICAEKYSRPYAGRYKEKPIPDTFYGMIANLDENLGKLESYLAANGLRRNTILIFLSDNGTQSRQAQAIYNAGMRNRKTSVFEGGHRVPCFIRWPAGGFQHDRDIPTLTTVQDLLPTLIELCDLKTPKDTSFDGLSLADMLKNTKAQLPDRKIVVQYKVSGEPWDPAVVLWDKWRLIGLDQLYHVGRDPGQRTNVAARRPDVVQAMSRHYDDWYADAKPLFDRPRWITIGSDQANPMALYAQDWTGGYCDNRGGLTKATAQGFWNVIVDRDGVYKIELRRWPRESDKPLTEGAKGPGDRGPSARPITTASLQIAGQEHLAKAAPGKTGVVFRIPLSAGRTRLTTTLSDTKGRTLCSAPYVYVKRLPGGSNILLNETGSAP